MLGTLPRSGYFITGIAEGAMDNQNTVDRALESLPDLVYIPDKLLDEVEDSCTKSDLRIQRILIRALKIRDHPDKYERALFSILTCIGQLALHLLDTALYRYRPVSEFSPLYVHEQYVHVLCVLAEEFAQTKLAKVFTVLSRDDELVREFSDQLRSQVVLMREKEILRLKEQYQSSLLPDGDTIPLSGGVYVYGDLPKDAPSQAKNAATGSHHQPVSTSTGELAPERVDRKTAVSSFLSKCHAETGILVTKSHIWKAVGRKSARQFQYWVNSDKKASRRDNVDFPTMLNMKPADFIWLLREKGLVGKG